jgi:hypothetical protein
MYGSWLERRVGDINHGDYLLGIMQQSDIPDTDGPGQPSHTCIINPDTNAKLYSLLQTGASRRKPVNQIFEYLQAPSASLATHFTLPSVDPVTRRVPSGLKATLHTLLACPLSVALWLQIPDCRLHNLCMCDFVRTGTSEVVGTKGGFLTRSPRQRTAFSFRSYTEFTCSLSVRNRLFLLRLLAHTHLTVASPDAEATMVPLGLRATQ